MLFFFFLRFWIGLPAHENQKLDFVLKTSKWETTKKVFYGVYFIVQWTSLWKKWWTSLWKKWSMYMWLDSSLWYLNEQEETAWLTFFWWSLSLCRVYKTEALPENEIMWRTLKNKRRIKTVNGFMKNKSKNIGITSIYLLI